MWRYLGFMSRCCGEQASDEKQYEVRLRRARRIWFWPILRPCAHRVRENGCNIRKLCGFKFLARGFMAQATSFMDSTLLNVKNQFISIPINEEKIDEWIRQIVYSTFQLGKLNSFA